MNKYLQFASKVVDLRVQVGDLAKYKHYYMMCILCNWRGKAREN